MKKIVLALLACTALAMPAKAEDCNVRFKGSPADYEAFRAPGGSMVYRDKTNGETGSVGNVTCVYFTGLPYEAYQANSNTGPFKPLTPKFNAAEAGLSETNTPAPEQPAVDTSQYYNDGWNAAINAIAAAITALKH